MVIDCFSSKKNNITKISINATIQLNLNIGKDFISFPNIKNVEFENIMVRSVICKIVFIGKIRYYAQNCT